MTVVDVFPAERHGLVATGRVTAGTIAAGETVRVDRTEGTSRHTEVTGIEVFHRAVDSATAGDEVGLLLHGVTRDDVGRGDLLSG